MEGHEFGGGVGALEQRILVQVGVIHGVQQLPQYRLGQADIHQQLQMIQGRGAEFGFHRVSGAVHTLGRAEFLTVEAMGDHDVVADGQAVHRF